MKDELFLRGQQVPMTKEAVRALALSRLELHRAQLMIDVGAGTGSVALEAALRYPQLRVIAIERNPRALALLEQNMAYFDCRTLRVINGVAPLEINEQAQAIFIGGSGGHLTQLIDWALAHLVEGGRLVMTFILQENLSGALQHLAHCPVAELDCQQIQSATLTALGSGHYFKPNNATFVISCLRRGHHESTF
ncbi:decarboxylating cobalt-precorrin-6B (C(15))-methyltransferase [Entomohabitans teleogrylli]|uniref:decarboxylating cobalt-precorrin-6B (C(15))-methyltransferase n=1 Tax=Entomohabitans teleogrylli TaxID=1384589 RepID=UPI00073D38D5|nr:decarboxylating cobalt-precorrin-6B (C(15))-methyltransferase [Entomohabitans teleogrylli]